MAEITLEDHLLECGICLDLLDNDSRMLPCQHTYCLKCLETLQRHEGTLKCPHCRMTHTGSLQNLPKNRTLLDIIDRIKRNPKGSKDEDEELAKVKTISYEEFMNEKATDLLLKHNEELQTQFALESSKQQCLIDSAKQISDEYSELVDLRLAMELSEEVSERRKTTDSISVVEKLAIEVGLIKSMVEEIGVKDLKEQSSDLTAALQHLSTWFSIHNHDLSAAQKDEIQRILKVLNGINGVQSNRSLLHNTKSILDSIEAESNSSNNSSGSKREKGTDSISEVTDGIKQLTYLLRKEDERKKTISNFHGHNHPMNYLQTFNYSSPSCVNPSYSRSSNNYEHSFPQNRENKHPSNKDEKFSRNFHSRSNQAPLESLILPETSLYDLFDKAGENAMKNEKNLPAASTNLGDIEQNHLILPDRRYYKNVLKKKDEIQQNHRSRSVQNFQYDTSFRREFGFSPNDVIKLNANSEKEFISRERGTSDKRNTHPKKQFYGPRRAKKNNGFESDSSSGTTYSTSSFSSVSSSSNPRYKGRNYDPNFKSKKLGQKVNFDKSALDAKPIPEKFNRRFEYPSQQEALGLALDLNQTLKGEITCYGKIGNQSIKQKARCLNDIYAFEKKYKDVQIIRN